MSAIGNTPALVGHMRACVVTTILVRYIAPELKVASCLRRRKCVEREQVVFQMSFAKCRLSGTNGLRPSSEACRRNRLPGER